MLANLRLSMIQFRKLHGPWKFHKKVPGKLQLTARLNRIKKIARHRNGTVTTEKCLKFQEL
jgi:hypothetical protein